MNHYERTGDPTPQDAPWPINTRVKRICPSGAKSGFIDPETGGINYVDRDGNIGTVVENRPSDGYDEEGRPFHGWSVVQMDGDDNGLHLRAVDVDAIEDDNDFPRWEVVEDG